MAPVLIVPGLSGSGSDHWQTHLERSIAGSVRVQMDDWDRPQLFSWLERLAQCVEASPGSVLVAHSLGCILVAHLAARHPDLPVASALLVAPADVESHHCTLGVTYGFAPIPRSELPFRAVVVASTNDPFMSFARAHELAQAWKAEFINSGASGHINVASGHGRWRSGEDIVRSLTAEASTADLSAGRRMTRVA